MKTYEDARDEAAILRSKTLYPHKELGSSERMTSISDFQHGPDWGKSFSDKQHEAGKLTLATNLTICLEEIAELKKELTLRQFASSALDKQCEYTQAQWDIIAKMEEALNKAEQFMLSTNLERAKSRGDYNYVEQALTALKEHKEKYK